MVTSAATIVDVFAKANSAQFPKVGNENAKSPTTLPWAYWGCAYRLLANIFPLSPVTVPGGFAKV